MSRIGRNRMFELYQLKNFVSDNCLSDWLKLYAPEQADKIIPIKVPSKPNENWQKLKREWVVKINESYQLVYSDQLVSCRLPCKIDKPTLIKYFGEQSVFTQIAATDQIVIVNTKQDIYDKWTLFKAQFFLTVLPSNTSVVIVNNKSCYKYHAYPKTVQTFQTVLKGGIEWLQLLRTQEAQEWNLITTNSPPDCKLLPNLTVQDEFTEVKQKLAWKWKDVGLLYWVGAKCRQYLHSNGIYSLTDPDLFLCLASHSYFNSQLELQKVMVKNMFDPVVPRELRFEPTNKYQKFVYLDIENSIDEQTFEANVNLVGLLYFDQTLNGWKYQSFISKISSPGGVVKNCIVQTQDWFKANIPSDYTVVHYTPADLVGIPPGYKTLDVFPILRDQYATSEYLQSLHLNNFKLKTVYNKLVEMFGLKNLYDNCSVKNGLQALDVLQKWCKTEDCLYELQGDSDEEDLTAILCPDQMMDAVIQYNYVDCLALLMAHMFVENCWDEKVKIQLKASTHITTDTNEANIPKI